jgi:hypothetical protein
MDVRRSVSTKVWMDSWFESLKPDEKLLWLYFITCPTSNMLGIFEVSIKRMSNDTGISQDRILTILKGFERVRKGYYWFENVFLPNWMKHQSMNTNMTISAKNHFDELSNLLKTKLKENGFESFESLSNGYQTLSKIEKEIEDEKEIENKPIWAENFKNFNSNIIYPFEMTEFAQAWDLWIAYRNERKIKGYKPIGEQAALQELSEFSKSNINTALAIIKQSIAKNWQGLFELKKSFDGKSKKQAVGEGLAEINRAFQEIREHEAARLDHERHDGNNQS